MPPKKRKTSNDTLDQVLEAFSTTPASIPVVIEAVAGAGKTHLLMSLMDLIGNHSSVLLLSFTRAAVRIARARSGMRLTTQTFDSFFHQQVKRSPEHFGTELEILETRQLAMELDLDPNHRCSFADQWYRLSDIRFVFVDEGQDSPPEAISLLEKLRGLDKRLVIVGDRFQAIFNFMNTVSLFDEVRDAVVIPMHTTRRCCPEVVDAVNELFPQLDMVSNCFWTFKGESVAFQARTNDALGVTYAKILFTLPWKCEVVGGDDEKFGRAVLRTIRQIYRIGSDEEAKATLKRRLCEPTRPNGPTLFFSTVHGFKGSEADVTVLCEDVDATNPDIDYKLRYVAVTRARFGVLDLASLRWWGTDTSKSFLMDIVSATCRDTAPRGAVYASAVVRHPVGLVRLGLSFNTTSFQKTPREPYAELRAILTSWSLERTLSNIVESEAIGGFVPTHDARYKRIFRILTPQQHASVCSGLARMRLRAMCIKAMVVTGNLKPTTRLAARGAYEYARLRRFKRFRRMERIFEAGHPPPLQLFNAPPLINVEKIAFGTIIESEGWIGTADIMWRDLAGNTFIHDYASSHTAKQWITVNMIKQRASAVLPKHHVVLHSEYRLPDVSLGSFGFYRRFYAPSRDIFEEIMPPG